MGSYESKQEMRDIVLSYQEECDNFMLTDFEVTLEDVQQMQDEWDREEGIYERIVAKTYAGVL